MSDFIFTKLILSWVVMNPLGLTGVRKSGIQTIQKAKILKIKIRSAQSGGYPKSKHFLTEAKALSVIHLCQLWDEGINSGPAKAVPSPAQARSGNLEIWEPTNPKH